MHAYVKSVGISLTVAMAAPCMALADDEAGKDVANWSEWTEMRREAVHATGLLDTEVTNRFNMLGDVRTMILTPNNQRLEYILYEVPYPYNLYGAEDGFVAFDNAELVQGDGLGDVRVQLAQENAMSPEQLNLSADQVDDRSVTRLIGESMRFENGQKREVEDLLIHPETGMVTHYVVQLDQEAIFAGERRTIPDNLVKITEQGQLRADVALSKIEDIQDFTPDLL